MENNKSKHSNVINFKLFYQPLDLKIIGQQYEIILNFLI